MERFRHGGGDLIGADLDFHVAILEATGNHFLAALGGLIHAALECGFRFSWLGRGGIRDDRLEQHRSVLAAIDQGGAELARVRMVELLTDSLDDLRKFRERRGGEAPLERRSTADQLIADRALRAGAGRPSREMRVKVQIAGPRRARTLDKEVDHR